MANPGLTDAQLVEAITAYEVHGSEQKAATALGLSRPTFQHRLNTAKARGIVPEHAGSYWTHEPHADHEIADGVVIVASDAHVWPFARSVSARALIEVTRELGSDVRLLVANGDFVDGARSNRHDPHGWNKRPTVKQEIEGVQALLHDWAMAAPRAERVYAVGNHDLNFERKLVSKANEFEGMPGFRLHDHFTGWDFAWACRINWESRQPVMVKHRQAGGVHAGYNNAMKSGVTMVTGHTHQLEVKPYGDYRGRRYGVQTGCLTDPNGPQFEYQEMGYNSHCEGFAVLTFRDGELLTPELCEVKRGRAWFRGRVWAEREQVAA